jgi:hypothetical protein
MSGHKPSLPSSSSSHLPASLQLLHQKQQEHAALQALHEASAELVARAERMAGMSGTMADGGESEYGERVWEVGGIGEGGGEDEGEGEGEGLRLS